MGIFGRFGKKQKAEELNDDQYIETILKHSKDEPIGIANQNVIYAGYNELGGYYYLQTYIIGKLNTKTKTGATLVIEGNNYTLDLKSDMDEIESEPTDIFKGNATRIDFEIEKDSVEQITRSTIKTLTLNIKKDKILFTKFIEKDISEENE